MIFYKLCTNTAFEFIELATFCSDIPIDNHRVRKEIREQFTRAHVTHISEDMVLEIILFAVSQDNDDEVQIFDIEPSEVWPPEFNLQHNPSYYKAGGDKN